MSIRRWLALLLLLGCFAGPASADPRDDEDARRLRRAENSVWQLLFGRQVLQEAEKQIGQPYRWGGKDGSKGFDCSGLTAFVYGSLGVDIAPNSLGQYAQGFAVDRGNIIAGDLLVFAGQGSPLHVGIYGGEGRFIHAPGRGKLIQWARLDDAYFKTRYIGARRLAPSLSEARKARGLPEALKEKDSTPLYKEKAP